jgi:hypothetical protein
MRFSNTRIGPCTACGLAAAALLACGGAAQAQRPGGIGGLGGGGSTVGNSGVTPSLPGGNGLIGNSSAALAGTSGNPFGGGAAPYGAGGAGPLAGGGFGGNGMSGGAFPGGLTTGPSGIPGSSPLGNVATSGSPLGGPGAVGGASGATSTSGASTGVRRGVSPYGALGVIAAAVPATAARPAARLAALSPAMQADFRDLASRSDRISPATRDGVEFGLDGTSVVLRGRAADEAEARALENLIRFAPGVREVRNEMRWPAP